MKYIIRKKILIILTILLTGCSKNKPTALPEPEPQQTIKIIYYSSDTFQKTYGDFLSEVFPNYKIIVLTPPNIDPQKGLISSWESFLEDQKPDIITGLGNLYPQFINKDLLVPIDSFIKNDNFDISNIHPGVIDVLRKDGQGKLYALARYFLSRALMYNKDLFSKYGVPFPNDQMTWDDVLNLAKHFNKQNGDVGLYIFNKNPVYLIERIASTSNLQYIDTQGKNIVISRNNKWEKTWQMVISAYRDGFYSFPNSEEYGDGNFANNLFFRGKAAMTLDIPRAILLNNKSQTQYAKFDWDFATEPVSAEHPNESDSFVPSETFSIYKNSNNIKAAWNVIREINGESFSKLENSKSSLRSEIPSRQKSAGNDDGKNWGAFYILKPKQRFGLYGNTPDQFQTEFSRYVRDEASLALAGSISVEQAFKKLEGDGEILLKTFNEK